MSTRSGFLAGLLLFAPLAASNAQDVTISGLIDVGFVNNFGDPPKGAANNDNQVFGFINEENTFTVALAQLAISKDADPVGFNLKLDFFTTAPGLDGANGAGVSAADDLAVQAANVVYSTAVGNGLALSVGKLETLIGFDVIESSANPHMSHGLLFALVPLTHLGIRASYPLADNLSVTVGLNNGTDQDVDDNRGKSIEAQVSYSPTEVWTANVQANYGAEGTSEGEKTFLLNAVTTYDVSEELAVYGEFTYANAGNPAGTRDAQFWGIGVGATYWVSDKYGVSGRYEYVDDTDNAILPAQYHWDLTLTGHAKLTDDLTFRIEYRHDEANSSVFVDELSTKDSQDTLGAQFLYTF